MFYDKQIDLTRERLIGAILCSTVLSFAKQSFLAAIEPLQKSVE